MSWTDDGCSRCWPSGRRPRSPAAAASRTGWRPPPARSPVRSLSHSCPLRQPGLRPSPPELRRPPIRRTTRRPRPRSGASPPLSRACPRSCTSCRRTRCRGRSRW